jgi:formylglycine-generating enzyme required for sulfatase activity
VGSQIDAASGNRPSAVGEDPTGRGTTPIGSVTASSLGLHDMPGNVSEWTADCSESGPPLAQAATDAAAATVPAACASRVVRGGNWSAADQPSDTRKRRVLSPDTRLIDLGFRIAIDY